MNAPLPKVIRPKQVYVDGTVFDQLDMRDANVFGDDLDQLIRDSVKATQAPLMLTLPNRIILSHKQFISVEKNTQEMDRTVDRIYLTPMNVMEVEIDQDYQHVSEDLLDVVIGYETEEDMGISKKDAKGLLLHD
jgi:hypothetical protein